MFNLRKSHRKSSQSLFETAKEKIPGAFSRAIFWMNPPPPYIESGKGSVIRDVEGRKYVDFLNNYTTLIHGHCHPKVLKATKERLEKGVCFGLPCPEEVMLAELLCDRIRSVEKIKFSNSGTEAVMLALKGARAFTGRSKIARLEGVYHGSHDYMEVSSSPTPDKWGEETRPNPVPLLYSTPTGILNDVLVLPTNNVEATLQLLSAHKNDLAAVIVDLAPQKCGFTPLDKSYVEALRVWTKENGSLLIVDEVISLRVSPGGAQELFNCEPDLTAMGKIIGGGFPVGAVGGRADVMNVFDHSQTSPKVPVSGTFSANPMTMTAGLISMQLLTPSVCQYINSLADYAREGMNKAFEQTGGSGQVTGFGSLLQVQLKQQKLTNYRKAVATPSEKKQLEWLRGYMIQQGFLFGPSLLGCTASSMTRAQVDEMVKAFANGIMELTEELNKKAA